MHIASVALAFSLAAVEPLNVDQFLLARLTRFPPADVVESWLDFARQRDLWLRAQMKLNPGSEEIHNWYKAHRDYFRHWLWLSCAQNANKMLNNRLENLNNLEFYLSSHNWCSGRMPEPNFSHFKQWKPSPAELRFLHSLMHPPFCAKCDHA
jgi:hypothetical protein